MNLYAIWVIAYQAIFWLSTNESQLNTSMYVDICRYRYIHVKISSEDRQSWKGSETIQVNIEKKWSFIWNPQENLPLFFQTPLGFFGVLQVLWFSTNYLHINVFIYRHIQKKLFDLLNYWKFSFLINYQKCNNYFHINVKLFWFNLMM